jgi:pilus assembly protein Flp/PilA
MRNFKEAVLKFVREEEGLTIVEYAVAGGLISAAVVVAFTALGGRVNTIIRAITTALGGTTP